MCRIEFSSNIYFRKYRLIYEITYMFASPLRGNCMDEASDFWKYLVFNKKLRDV